MLAFALTLDDKAVNMRLGALSVVGKSVVPQHRKSCSCSLTSVREEVAKKREGISRGSEDSGTRDWRSQLRFVASQILTADHIGMNDEQLYRIKLALALGPK